MVQAGEQSSENHRKAGPIDDHRLVDPFNDVGGNADSQLQSSSFTSDATWYTRFGAS
jgi:hypothetical protein